MSAKSFWERFQAEAHSGYPMVGSNSFLLDSTVLSWFQINFHHFRNYLDLKVEFLRKFYNEALLASKLVRLQSYVFDPRRYKNVEEFVVERIAKIRDVAQSMTETVLCNVVVRLLSPYIQKQLATIQYLNVPCLR